jgi:ribosomal-protein-serine acetyltransferase
LASRAGAHGTLCPMVLTPRGDVPASRIEVDGLVIRRLTVHDAAALAKAISDSFDHLVSWMPWATPEATTERFQRRRLRGPSGSWEPDGEYSYGILLPESSAVIGAAGLHRRIGPKALELGYWVHVDHTGKGVATTAARALTSACFDMQDITHVEIHCDAANHASAAVPRKLGFHLVGEDARIPEAPSEEGRRLMWRMTKDQWLAPPPAVGS